MATDWKALKVEYVNTAIEYKELAEKHGLKPGTVRQRGNRERWGDERNAASKLVTQAVTEQMSLTRAQELANFNDDDVRVARAIRSKAAGMLKTATSPHELRALSAAFESAQRIGRLALGASTENSSVQTAPAGLDHFYAQPG